MASRGPGWYPDPSDKEGYRWWDGRAWTPWCAESEDADFPPPGDVERVVPVRVSAASLLSKIGLGLVVVAALLGLVSWLGVRYGHPTLPAPAAATPSDWGTPEQIPDEFGGFTFDPNTRAFKVEPVLKGQAPGRPFAVSGLPQAIVGMFDKAVMVYVDKSPAYVPEKNWPPMVMLGIVDPDIMNGEQNQALRDYADLVRTRLYKKAGERSHSDLVVTPLSDYGTHAAVKVEQQVTYALQSSDPRTDTLVIYVIKLTDDIKFAWVELRASDITPEQAALMDTYRASIAFT